MKKVLFLQYFAVLVGIVGICVSASADADTDSAKEWQAKPQADNQEIEVMGTNDRLPLVVPGEVVSNGRRYIRIWSTVGPVPVQPGPRAPVAPQAGAATQQPLQVIVDSRKNRSRKPRHDRPDYSQQPVIQDR